MKLTRYEPWNVLNNMRDEMNRLFNDRLPSEWAGEDQSNVLTSMWAPAVDIKEEKDRFVIRADVPGVDPKDIDVTMEAGVLTIRGERKAEHKEEGEGYYRQERVRGTFYRRFALPDTAEAEGITARGDKGVLEIAIPKKAKAQPKRIEVKH